MNKKILLVDGNLLLFKSYYSTLFNKTEYQNSKNLDTRTIHRFMNTFLNVLNNLDINYCFVAFDAKGKTKRHLEYENYKTGRKRPDPIIYEYKKYIIELLEKMNIFWYEKEGAEADDLIGTISKQFQNDDHEFIIFSDDQDMLQLIDKNISVLYKNKSTKNYELKTINNFFELHNINPKQIIDLKAISGDPSDNLPGINGVGKIGAIKLINQYGSLEEIYNNLDSLNDSLTKKFIESKDMAFLCKKIAKIDKNIDVAFLSIEDFKIKYIKNEDSINFLKYLELESLIKLMK
ncbi:MAG: 5'-3' exonuclease [Metamycoplasmataceae bacterium]